MGWIVSDTITLSFFATLILSISNLCTVHVPSDTEIALVLKYAKMVCSQECVTFMKDRPIVLSGWLKLPTVTAARPCSTLTP